MKYAAIHSNKFTGVVYDELTLNVQQWADNTDGITLLAISSETEALILAAGLTGQELAVSSEMRAFDVRAERDSRVSSCRWRIERHNDAQLLGIEPAEPLEPLLRYVQQLRDVPEQVGFPESIEWPECP